MVSIDRVTNTDQVSSRAQLPPTFSSIITGSRLVTINQSSQVVYDMKNIELSMVLDITGSMNQKNKINDLKTAAKDIIDDLSPIRPRRTPSASPPHPIQHP